MKEASTLAIKIITDNVSDIALERQKELDIEILPLKVHFGSEEFIPGVNLSDETFYARLATAKELPKTSQVPPEEFKTAFERHLANGDQVVCITISAGISGTYQSAMIAAQDLQSEDVFVVNSENATIGQALLVFEAVKMRDQGLPAREIAQTLETEKKKVSLLVVLDTLKYLHKGGRLPLTAAVIGEVLGIKPIVTMIHGEIKLIGKGRGREKAQEFIYNQIKNAKIDKSKLVTIGHTNAAHLMKTLEEGLLQHIEDFVQLRLERLSVGPIIGTYGGANCFAVAYVRA